MQSEWLNSALSPVVHGDIAPSIKIIHKLKSVVATYLNRLATNQAFVKLHKHFTTADPFNFAVTA